MKIEIQHRPKNKCSIPSQWRLSIREQHSLFCSEMLYLFRGNKNFLTKPAKRAGWESCLINKLIENGAIFFIIGRCCFPLKADQQFSNLLTTHTFLFRSHPNCAGHFHSELFLQGSKKQKILTVSDQEILRVN